MPEPSWLGNAQADIIAAAILGLPAVCWKFRFRWLGWLALVVWLLAVAVLVYHTVHGNLGTLVPPFVLSRFPGWALIIAFAVGALAGAGVVRFASRPSHMPPTSSAQELPLVRPTPEIAPPAAEARVPAASPSPVPASTPEAVIDPQEALWQKLNAHEHEVLQKLWSRDGQYVFLRDCHPWKSNWGIQKWNAAIHNLTELRLIVEGLRSLPHATQFMPSATIELTKKGATLMTWCSRSEPHAE
jgi:hypothetical protein